MRTASILALLLACAAGAPAAAQRHPLVPVAQLGFVGDLAPALTGGVRWTYTPTPQPVRDPATGMFRPVVVRWYAQALATAGVTFAEGDPVGFTAVGSAGVLRPIGAGPVAGAGVVALASLGPDALGPAVRVETSFRALGVQAGALWFTEGDSPRAAVTVDVAVSFVCDLVGC
jgi:hypothetical protein